MIEIGNDPGRHFDHHCAGRRRLARPSRRQDRRFRCGRRAAHLRVPLVRRPSRHTGGQAARRRIDVDGFQRDARRGDGRLQSGCRFLRVSRSTSQSCSASEQRRMQASQAETSRSHSPRPSLRHPQHGRPVTGPDAKDMRTMYVDPACRIRIRQPNTARTPPPLKSRNESTAFASVMRHRCEQPLRVVLPAHRLGDRAGRSPGSRVSAFRQAFPVSQWPTWTNARRLQLRGQPRFHLHRANDPCSLLPPRCNPGNQHDDRFPRERTSVKIRLALRCRCNAVVALALQQSGEDAANLDRLAGLARDAASRLPRSEPVTHTASYAIQSPSVHTKSGPDADSEIRLCRRASPCASRR